jgi:ribosomal protein S8
MWTVIYISPTLKLAERIRDRLTQEGFLVQIRSTGSRGEQYEIRVPESELHDVRELISSLFG